MPTTTRDTTEATSITRGMVPDGKLAREGTKLVRDTESSLLFNHSTRVYYLARLLEQNVRLKFALFDEPPELHSVRLMAAPKHRWVQPK